MRQVPLKIPRSCFVVVDKPLGIRSREVTSSVRRWFELAGMGEETRSGVEGENIRVSRRERRKRHKRLPVGHVGTLDPNASGVLPIAIGRATKFIQFLPKTEKIYQSTFLLGISTSTDDAEGDVIGVRDMAWTTPEKVSELLKSQFIGNVHQVPPTVSARRIGGKRMHELARKGQLDVDHIAASSHHVSKIDIHSLQVDCAQPELDLTIECSQGFFIRGLARDLGLALLQYKSKYENRDSHLDNKKDLGENGEGFLPGAGSVLHLRRLKSSGFSIDDCVEFNAFENNQIDLTMEDMQDNTRYKKKNDLKFIHISAALDHLPSVCLSSDQAKSWQNGHPFLVEKPVQVSSQFHDDSELNSVRVFNSHEEFLGVAAQLEANGEGWLLKPKTRV